MEKYLKNIDKNLYNLSKNKYLFYFYKIVICFLFITFTIFFANFSSNRFIDAKLDRAREKDYTKKDSIKLIISRFIKYFIYLIGFYIVFSFLGFNTSLIFATFGTFGITAALGLQDFIKNFISGVLFTSSHKYQIGDVIETSAVKIDGEHLIGKLVYFDTLTIKIQDIYSGILYILPSSKVWDSTVGHYNYFQKMFECHFKIVISGENDFKKALKITENVCKQNKRVIKHKHPPLITMGYDNKFYGIYIDVRFYTYLDHYPKIVYELKKEIMLKLQENNIIF